MYFDEILDHFKFGKKIRRAIWPIGVTISRNFDSINIKDLLANDWEVIEPKEKKTWWKPKVGESYWSIRPWSGTVRTCYYDHKIDGFAVSMGLCFQTEEQAKFMVEKLRVIHELEKFAYENNTEEIDWDDKDQRKYYLILTCTGGKNRYMDATYTFELRSVPFNVYFTSEEIAKKAIETIGEGRLKKYYFGVKDE